MQPWLTPVTLAGRHVILEPIAPAHGEDLRAAVAIDDLWRITVSTLPSPATMTAYIERLLNDRQAGVSLAFAIRDRASGKAVGSTRYMALRPADRGLEIGGTWLGVPWQRTAINTEAKFLLLQHAFETLGCLRVEFKTDVLNERSRRAILRLGATQEGVFRRHMIMPDGRVRDSVYFSIVDRDWPAVKTRLQEKLNLRSGQSV
jgi:RimJ/RimL family protein N-acetyltransferase